MNSRPDDTLAQLTAAGVAIWLDDISRERLSTGNLEGLVRDLHVQGVTSNPTIFAKAISSGSAYREQIADLAVRGVSIDEAARAVTTYDIRWACDVLRPVYDQTPRRDGRVSLERDPRIPRATAEAQAVRGEAALANARVAYELFEQRFAAPRWSALSARGARVQRPLWASTSVKDPAFADAMYVVDLVAPDTVNTMPEATLHAVQAHGTIRGDTIHGTYAQARRALE